MSRLRVGRLPGAPIWIQILSLLIGGLVAAQVVTLGLTILLPPQPPQIHSLDEIARALQGRPLDDEGGHPLVRRIEAQPPSLQSPGWAVSPRATADLAQRLGAPETDVRLLFYAPPPLAGVAPRGLPPPARVGELESPLDIRLASFGPVGPVRRPQPPGVEGPRGRTGPGAGRFPSPMRRSPMTDWPAARVPDAPDVGVPTAAWPRPAEGGVVSLPTGRPGGAMEFPDPPAGADMPMASAGGAYAPDDGSGRPAIDLAAAQPFAIAPAAPEPVAQAAPAPLAEPATPAAVPLPPRAAKAPAARVAETGERPLAEPEGARGLFGFGRGPNVAGEFVAALRQADGRWVTVRPKAEGFPDSWQQRVLLWFVLSLALVGPVGFLLARRLAAPLKRFADAAEQLGRDPAADLAPLEGPAEVGRAAEAFNRMQRRLKRYVEDRTSMVGAISHDLRTPLARMRFKLERAPPSLRAALDRDITQMEEMITSVLSFMRDEAHVGERRRIDLRSVLECAVDEAGGPVVLADGAPVEVEADPVALQRVFDNLIGNALKYGERAEVALIVEDDEAVIRVADDGPGMSDEDLANAFKPFHRSDAAKASGKAGMGLGLTVSRAAIRAHGGDLTLRRGREGLVAEVRLPLSRRVSLAA